MERIIDRVNDYIQYKGISIRAFENEAGIKYSTISAAIKRGTELNTATLLKIIDTYDEIDTDWLMKGEGEMIKSDSPSAETSLPTADIKPQDKCSKKEYDLPSTDEFEYINNDNNGKIPILSELNFAIADPDEPSKVTADDYYYIKEFRNADFMLRISGDYMAPKYRSGDLIACRHDRYNTFYQWGRIYALLTCSLGLIVGRVYEHHQNTIFITVKPENPAYPEWEVPIDEVAKAALVVGSISLD